MGALTVHLKATYLQMRIYIWMVITLILLGRLAEFIVGLFIDSSQNTGIADGNLLLLILLIFAIVLPLSYYNRIVHLGASRKNIFSVFNSFMLCGQWPSLYLILYGLYSK